MEAVRLVIWDLDETFWSGTLSEEGMTYNRKTHDIVIELARRGILSSVCSKNDLDRVRPILEGNGIWDFFVFPSINWEPKGQRVAKIVELVQLRPSTVLLLDDNPMNLKEAQFFTPELQVATEAFIDQILESPLMKGTADKTLHRLSQYKILERKNEDKVRFSSDNTAFLRVSDIKVRFEYDVKSKIDRVIELINRTNQLNFTKRRLPEDKDAAKSEITALLSHYQTQAALIQVKDRYGDYGDVGFYAQRRDGKGTKLIHFCFSCRTLNMGIETWVYRHLGRPNLTVQDEVLTDVKNDLPVIDWIREVRDSADGEAIEDEDRHFDRIISHGGCDQRALAHYFARHANTDSGEYNISRHGLQLRTDNSYVLRQSLNGIPPAAIPDLEALGFKADDFQTDISKLEGKNNLVLLSFWMDNATGLFRHRATGAIVPYSRRELEERYTKTPLFFYSRAREILAEAFDPLGLIKDEDFKANVEFAVRSIGERAQIVIIAGNTLYRQNGGASSKARTRQNWSLTEVARGFSNVQVVNVEDYINDESEAHTTNHFDRMVYYRMYKDIMTRLQHPAPSSIEIQKTSKPAPV